MIGDKCDVDVSRTPLRKCRLILALVGYQSLLAINLVAAVALARHGERGEGQKWLVGSSVNEDGGVFTNDTADVCKWS